MKRSPVLLGAVSTVLFLATIICSGCEERKTADPGTDAPSSSAAPTTAPADDSEPQSPEPASSSTDPIYDWIATGVPNYREPPSAADPQRLPPSARQTREGYWLAAMIGPEDVPNLGRMGIRAVLSAHQPDEFTIQLLEDYGIDQVGVPMSDTFLHADTILEVVDRHDPDEILIHCWHGADRTGVITAFLLVMRHDWIIQDAFYSVLAPTRTDVIGLAEILATYDLPDPRAHDDPTVGFYSVAATGGNGGLKAHASGYVRLISTTLDTIERLERGEDFVPWDGQIDWLGPPEPANPSTTVD